MFTKKLNRQFIGIELDETYFEASQKRIFGEEKIKEGLTSIEKQALFNHEKQNNLRKEIICTNNKLHGLISFEGIEKFQTIDVNLSFIN